MNEIEEFEQLYEEELSYKGIDCRFMYGCEQLELCPKKEQECQTFHEKNIKLEQYKSERMSKFIRYEEWKRNKKCE